VISIYMKYVKIEIIENQNKYTLVSQY